MNRIKVISASVLLSLSLAGIPADTVGQEEEQKGPIFVKVYAGKSHKTRREFRKIVSRNLKRRTEIPDESTIACEPGEWYGLGVVVSAPGRQFINFETTAIWRDLDRYDQPRRSMREHTLRKNEFGTRRFFFKIRDRSVDHDMTFVAHIGSQVYLRHKFLIRGCQSESADA